MTGRRGSARRRPATPARRRGFLRSLLDVALAAAILGALALVAARLGGIGERSLDGQARVADGDSIELGNERVRLRGIDAPELGQTCRKADADYPCGRLARDALVKLIGGAQVTCEGSELDRYGRLLAVCSAKGVNLNRELVQMGWAVAFGDYESEEATARQAGSGLWAGSFDRPRDWRTMHGGMAESEHATLARIYNWLRQVLRL